MKTIFSIFTLLLVSIQPSALASNPVVKIQEAFDSKTQKSISVVTLKNGKKLQDVGYTLSYIGEMKYKGNSALLFRGVVCADCSADLSLFVQPMIPNARKTQFTFPGRITSVQTDRSNGTTFKNNVMKIRTFFGDCLGEYRSNLINVKEPLIPGKTPEKTIEVWDLHEKGDLVFSSTQKEIVLNDISAAVKSKKCTEIKGSDRDTHED